MGDTVDLLERPVYGMAQVDHVLGLSGGTAQRWIDGYVRGGKTYDPVVRLARTGDELVTWGEFVESRFLAEYRDAGVPMVKMRPAIERLRESFNQKYPLAHAKPFVAGKELVLEMQESVGLAAKLQLVVVRNGQLLLTEPAENFYSSAEFSADDVVRSLRPVSEIKDVLIDPLRQFGEPVVGGVRTDIVAEQIRAGETIDAVAELYDLDRHLVEAALRYELVRRTPSAAA